METRKNLIIDIETYIDNTIEVYNDKGIVDKLKYEKLSNRISSLTEKDFENSEKHRYFLGYINQTERKMKSILLENSFYGNHLEVGAFLFLTNNFRGVANWLK